MSCNTWNGGQKDKIEIDIVGWKWLHSQYIWMIHMYVCMYHALSQSHLHILYLYTTSETPATAHDGMCHLWDEWIRSLVLFYFSQKPNGLNACIGYGRWYWRLRRAWNFASTIHQMKFMATNSALVVMRSRWSCFRHTNTSTCLCQQQKWEFQFCCFYVELNCGYSMNLYDVRGETVGI